MEEQKIKIFLVDDHHVFRDAIRILIEGEIPATIVGEAAKGSELLAKLKNLEVDLLLLDIDMPDTNGLKLMKEIHKLYPSLAVLVFSSHDDEEYIHHMITNGVKGYILKSCRREELMQAIKSVFAGEVYLCSKVSKIFFQYLEKKAKQAKKIKEIPLTKREFEILKLVAKGLTNQVIGEKLFISHRTVDTHRRNIMVKLDLHNAAALTHFAAKNGLIKDDIDGIHP